MDERTLSIMSGIAQGLEKAATNLQNISMKKEELRVEREKFALDKKVKDAQLKKLEFETSPEAIADLRETHNVEMKSKKAAFDLSQMKIGKAELENRKQEIELNKTADIIAASYTGNDPFLQQLAKTSQEKTGLSSMEAKEEHYGSAEGSQAKPRIPTQSGMQTTAVVDGQITPTKPYYKEKASFVTPKADHIRELKGLVNKGAGNKDIEDYLAIRGYDWEDFERLGILQKRQAGSDFSRSDFLPKNIKKTSEAVEYIMREHGKTKKEAIELLKEQQGQ